jgi:hypothetical protein
VIGGNAGPVVRNGPDDIVPGAGIARQNLSRAPRRSRAAIARTMQRASAGGAVMRTGTSDMAATVMSSLKALARGGPISMFMVISTRGNTAQRGSARALGGSAGREWERSLTTR